MELLSPTKTKLSVSSVLDRNAREYGKKFLVDGEDDTCWNSDQVWQVDGLTYEINTTTQKGSPTMDKGTF